MALDLQAACGMVIRPDIRPKTITMVCGIHTGMEESKSVVLFTCGQLQIYRRDRVVLRPELFANKYNKTIETETYNLAFHCITVNHIGSIFAGVVGSKIPRYNLYGDSINVTVAMRDNCERK